MTITFYIYIHIFFSIFKKNFPRGGNGPLVFILQIDFYLFFLFYKFYLMIFNSLHQRLNVPTNDQMMKYVWALYLEPMN